MAFISTTLDTSHFERSPLNEVAPANIAPMVVTPDTSHFEMSPLNELASSNILPMLVTLDTSHSSIGPCGPLVQSPFRDNFRHLTTALLSSGLDCGENTSVGWGRGETLGLSSKCCDLYNLI